KNDIAGWSATSEIIAVFHTNAGHVTLHDTAYNADRNIATGNPYKDLISDLQKRGVKVELCGATAKAHGWGNKDLLPDIKVNTDTMARTTQLVQQGFVKITERGASPDFRDELRQTKAATSEDPRIIASPETL